MEVLLDNGVYRHLSFTNNGSSVYRFDITTWPGHLCISGDMGTQVFSRLHDMFEFFNDDLDSKFPINPGYWGEKLQAIGTNSGYQEFSVDLFKENVWYEFNQFAEEYADQVEDEREVIQDDSLRDETESVEDVIAHRDPDAEQELTKTEQSLKDLKEAIQDEVLDRSHDGAERAYDAAMNFQWEAEDGTKFYMQDFWEHDCQDYTFHYIWVLYAIVYGIGQYNTAKQEVTA